jgi:hypothetical protein
VIARQAGLSPATVMDVRHRLKRGLDPVAGPGARTAPRLSDGDAAGDRGAVPPAAREPQLPVTPSPVENPAQALAVLRGDPSVRYTVVGRRLLMILLETIDLTPEILLRSLPVHTRARFAALARVAETTWSQVAAELERTDPLAGE